MTSAERQKRYAAKWPERVKARQRAWKQKHPGYLGPTRQAVVDKVNAIKEMSPCVDCHNRFPACCMDFDHLVNDKHQEVGVLIARSKAWDVVEAEIKKCELVCANCHRIRTRDRGSKGWTRERLSICNQQPCAASQRDDGNAVAGGRKQL